MSGDKAKLKHEVARRAPFSARALRYPEVPFGVTANGFTPHITLVFEDASMRLSYARARNGAELADGFTAQWLEAFRFASVGAYVMCLDKSQFVPARKAATQRKRTRASEASADRKDVECFAYDARGPPLVAADSPLPPLERLRGVPAAKKAYVAELVALIIARAPPLPPGKRVIIDWPGGSVLPDGRVAPVVIRADEHGNMLAPYHDARLANMYGEADTIAQFYARVAREGLADIPEGDAQLVSTDTDFFVLSALQLGMARREQRDRGRNIYLVIGKQNMSATGSRADAHFPDKLQRYEICDIGAVCDVVRDVLRSSPENFAAFCVACGNDYVARPKPLTHAALYETFFPHADDPAMHTPARSLVCGAGSGSTVLPGAFVDMVRRACHAARGCAAKDTLLQDEAAVQRYYVSVCWALQYCVRGVPCPVYEALWDEVE